MKKLILLPFAILYLIVNAQTIERFYNWQWKPCEVGLASFYTVIKNTDSGWLRYDYYVSTEKLQMSGLYKDSACKIQNGLIKYFYSNGYLDRMVKYSDNKKEGLSLSFFPNGMLKDSTVYLHDEEIGTSLSFYQNGYSADSAVYNEDGSSVNISWFDNGNISSAGRKKYDKKYGKWVFYHKNGQTAAIEVYQNDRLVSRSYFNEQGMEVSDTTNKDRSAAFAGGNEKWRKYLEKNLVWPTQYKLVNTDIVTVIVKATIDEDGNIQDVFMDVPFKKAFDDEALRVMKRSPKWLPAISHNRRVKTYVRQPLSFQQVEY